jgi:hypothetical protein
VKLFVHANQWRVKKFADKEGVMDIYEVVGKKEISGPAYHAQDINNETAETRIH